MCVPPVGPCNFYVARLPRLRPFLMGTVNLFTAITRCWLSSREQYFFYPLLPGWLGWIVQGQYKAATTRSTQEGKCESDVWRSPSPRMGDSIMKQDMSLVKLFSGRRLEFPSKFLDGSRLPNLTATSICPRKCCSLSENLVGPSMPIPTLSHFLRPSYGS